MKNINFEFARKKNGSCEFEDFLDGLPNPDRDKLLALILKIEEVGIITASKMEWVKKLTDNVFEVRSKRASNIQRAFYFHVVNNRYIITHGLTKKTQKTPAEDIKHAKQVLEDYLKGELLNE
jgi:phage-related protein